MVNVWNKGFLTKGLLLIFLRRCISFSWMKKMFFYRQNFATKNKIANIREIHQHPDRCKKIRMQLFLHFYSILKKIRAREKPEMVWEEALILNSCCLPTNCSVLLLERQETRDDETSLGEKRKAVLGFSIGGNLVPGIIDLVTASSYITHEIFHEIFKDFAPVPGLKI